MVQPTKLNERVPVLLDVQVCLIYTAGTQCTWSADKTSVLRVPHAFGNGFPTATAGPGQVALFTGEFNTDSTDVKVPGYTGALSISRSHSTLVTPALLRSPTRPLVSSAPAGARSSTAPMRERPGCRS